MEFITRDEALKLLKKYNKESFHIQHALTVEAVMKWYAKELGYEEDAEYKTPLHKLELLEKGEHKFWSEAVQAEGGSGEKIVNVPELALHRSFGEGPFNNETSNWGDERWYANNIRNVFWLIKKDSDSALPEHDEYLNAE